MHPILRLNYLFFTFKINLKIQLRRFNGTRAAKVEMDEPGTPGGSLQLWLCMDNVLMVKHIQAVNANEGGTENGGGRSTGVKRKGDNGNLII